MKTKIQVIIIEDEMWLAETYREFLEAADKYEVEVYTDPLEGFKRLAEKKFDVISLDQRMPGMTGMQLVSKLRTNPGLNQRTPILLISGYKDEVEHLHPELIEDLLFVEKPVQMKSYIVNIQIAWRMQQNLLTKNV